MVPTHTVGQGAVVLSERIRLGLLSVCMDFIGGKDMEFPTEIVGDKGYIHVTSDLDTEVAGEALRSAFNEIYEQGKRTIVLDLWAPRLSIVMALERS